MLSYPNNNCIISTIPLNENEELKTNIKKQQSLIDEQFIKDFDSPQSGSETFNNAPIIEKTLNNSILGRHFLGTLFVSLPDGLILECHQNNNNLFSSSNLSEEENQKEEEKSLNKILKIGDSLFSFLQGKGAQTMLLNAFCGHSRRRMYARIKWGSEGNIRACELICEFSIDPQNSTRRLANIQLFCVQSNYIQQQQKLINKNKKQQLNNSSLIFTTRHNSGCALIYLDSTSIPLLGHFPSEVTGKSLFTIVHPEDAHLIKDAHQKLHSKGGTQIVRSSGLRFLTYSGDSVEMESEWAAFVNPWTKHIEMVVGRHTFNILQINKLPKTEKDNNNLTNDEAIYSYRDKQALIVQALLSEPINNKEQNQTELVSPTLLPFCQQQNQHTYLSYNQINCLENVHRLLKSQSNSGTEEDNGSFKSHQNIEKDREENRIETIQENSFPSALTKELLQQHNKRLEEEFRDNWRRRFSSNKTFLKRKLTKEKDILEEKEEIPLKQLKKEFDKSNYYKSSLENFLDCGLTFKRKSSNNLINKYSPKCCFVQEIGLILNCLKEKEKNEIINLQQNQHLIKQLNYQSNIKKVLNNNNNIQNSELLEQLLQAANMARNTLALKLLQQDNNKQMNINNNYIQEQQCQFI